MAVLVLLALAVLAAGVYSFVTLRREALGREIHAHSDGTVHSHHQGSRPHAHPTFVERYDARLDRIFRG